MSSTALGMPSPSQHGSCLTASIILSTRAKHGWGNKTVVCGFTEAFEFSDAKGVFGSFMNGACFTFALDLHNSFAIVSVLYLNIWVQLFHQQLKRSKSLKLLPNITFGHFNYNLKRCSAERKSKTGNWEYVH